MNGKYIDGFVFPIAKAHLKEYQAIANQVASIWKKYGALAYYEFLENDPYLEGTQSFRTMLQASDEEAVIFGWVVFPSKQVRDQANQSLPKDEKMNELVAPLFDPERRVFNAKRMVYGGFESLVNSDSYE